MYSWLRCRISSSFRSSPYTGGAPGGGSGDPSSSSPSDLSSSLPVVDFCFQEPEDDPRHFCYLWAARSETDFDTAAERLSVRGAPAALSLAALSYEARDDHEQYGVLYSGLRSCSVRFEHSLGSADAMMRDDEQVRRFSIFFIHGLKHLSFFFGGA